MERVDDEGDLPGLHRQQSRLIDGAYVSAERAKVMCEKRGLCPKCCEVQTHERKRAGLQWKMIPLTTTDIDGKYLVYKGYCISSLCYSLDEAKRALGEPVETLRENGKKKTKRRSKKGIPSSRSEASAPARISRLESLLREAPKASRKVSGSASVSGSVKSSRSSRRGSSRYPREHSRSRSKKSDSREALSSGGSGMFGSFRKIKKRSSSSSRRYTRSSGSDRSIVSAPGGSTPLVSSVKVRTQEKDASNIAIQELDRLVQEQSYNAFMETLSSNKTLPDVVKRAFQLLRNNIYEAHKTMGCVFKSSSWIKDYVDAMESNQKDSSVQKEGVLTLWTFSAVSTKYLKHICKRSGVDAILSVMRKFDSDQEIVEICCGALLCLTGNPKDGLAASHSAGKRALTQLVKHVRREQNSDGIRAGGGSPKSLAIRALYNLAVDDDDAASSVGSMLGADSLINTIQRGEDVNSVECSIHLLWRLLSKGCITVSPFDIIEAVLGVFPSYESTSFKEAACGIISCAANLSSEGNHVASTLQTRKVAESIVATATSHARILAVQMMCIEAMCSLCSQPDSLPVVADIDVVAMIVNAMDSNTDDVDLQGAACLLLSYLCEEKEFRHGVANEKGTVAIATALRMHGTNSLVREASATALVALATDAETAGALIRSGAISDLDSALGREQDSTMPTTLHIIVRNVLSVGEGLDSDSRMAGRAMEILQATETVEEAEGMLSQIFAMAASSNEALFSILGVHGGSGRDILLQTMQTFLQSEVVQRNGCAILANMYVSIPYDGKLNSKTQVLLESQSIEVETHTEKEIKALVSAMNKHKSSAEVQEYGCTALCNFIVGVESGAASPEIHIPDDVVAAFAGISKKVIDAFSIHQQSTEVLTSACRLYWVIAFMNDETEMKLRGSHVVTKICEAMSKFATDDVLNYAGCGVLSTMLANRSHTEFIGSHDAVVSIFNCIRSADKKLVEIGSELLASIIKNVFTASNEFMEIENSIEKAVLCMNTHSNSAPIQKSMCEFIVSLVNLQDSYVKGLIGNNGGLLAIGNAMTNHADDVKVVECGCRALSSIVAGCKPSVISEQNRALGSILMHSMTDHPSNEVVQEAVLGALCGLCAREPTFNDYIISSNGIPKIVNTLNKHVMLEPVVVSGCSLLWVMASYGDNKRLIGREGIRAVVNGMQAHITSSSVQKEALTALKNLATYPDNKAATSEVGGVAAIVQCMWVHMNSSQIFCAACSALNNIAVHAKTKQVSNVENGELAAICFGMKRFECDKDAQMCACFLLKSYCFAPSNIPLLRDEPNLATILMAAMERFPAECQDRAYYVLQRI